MRLITAEQLAAMIHGVTSRIPRPDGSQPVTWEELTQPDRDRSIEAVIHIMRSEPLTAERGHEIWLELKVRDGWTLGDYCSDSKTHPCIVPFDALPLSEKLKDETWACLTELFRPYVVIP